jgi:hypothetical protein
VAGFGAAIWNTRRTIAHARESRVWDRRADVYVEALAAVHHRQIRREFETQTGPLDDQTRKRTQEYIAIYQQSDWHMLEGRLLAFASEPVITAVQASSAAHRDAIEAFMSWQAAGASSETRKAVDKTRKAAEAADDAIVEQIRTELQGRGQPLGDWQTFPASGSS